MDNQNVTVSLPKPLLRKLRLIAVQRESSVSGLLRHVLAEIVAQEDQYERDRRRHLTLMKDSRGLGTEGISHWTREELHDR